MDRGTTRTAWCCLRELMSQLDTIKIVAQLRDLSHKRAILSNKTRWTGKFQTVRRFFQIEEYIRTITELDNYLPTPAQQCCLETVLTHFWNFESIATHLQSRSLMLGGAQFILDTLCEDYPETAKYLSTDSTIVHNCPFQNIIIKVMKGNESQLTATGQTAL